MSGLTRQNLQAAIDALYLHRTALGEGVVSTAVAALQEKLAALATEPGDRESRVVVVVVADLAGFTAVSESLDAEQVQDTVNVIWQRLDAIVMAWGGVVDKHVGDGLIAIFGLDMAIDRAVGQAIHAAMDMQLELQRLRQDWMRYPSLLMPWHADDTRLQMRIGIHTGPVFWGPMGSTTAFTAVGDVVRAAELLEARAPLGGTVISTAVFQLMRGAFDIYVMDSVSLQPSLPPEPMYLVRGAKELEFDVAEVIVGQKPGLVGRDNVLLAIQDEIQAALLAGESMLITVVGEVGVGKTRLLHEIYRWLQMDASLTIWRGRARPEMGHMPLALFFDVLARQFQVQRWHSPALAQQQLAATLRSRFPNWADRAEEMARILVMGLSFGGGDEVQVAAAGSAGASPLQPALLRAVLQVVMAVARQQPVVLLLEDLHFADPSSLSLLEHMLAAARQLPVVALCLTRPSLYEQRAAWPRSDILSQRFDLVPLSLVDSRHLAYELLAAMSGVPGVLAEFLVTGAQGNPLQMVELVNWLLLQEILELGAGGRVQVRLSGLQQTPLLPDTPAVLLAQLEQLTPVERDVLQRAAVVGPVFWETAVQFFYQQPVNKILASLERKRFIYRRNGSYFPETQEYAFRHHLLHQTTYRSLPPAARSTLHSVVATWWQARRHSTFPGVEQVIAFHQSAALGMF